MKETPLSTCERNFILQAIKQNQRLDGRKNDEFRKVKINFGADFGSVLVALGQTKVLAQVSCELGIPKATRPNEGSLWLNVEMGPMAAPHFEAGRNSELIVTINRTLERTFKDSRCLDLESLCVTAEERVWVLRVDLNVLNHEGNLIDCCSIAALCALAHFKRPDVSIIDDDAVIHTAAEKEPIPMVLHHYPVCVSYCTFDEGHIAVADPSAAEERTADSLMVFGLNSFQELCCLNLGGKTLTSSMLLLQCAKRAAKHAKLMVDRIKKILQDDSTVRETGEIIGFTECLRLNKITGLAEDRLALKLRHFNFHNIHEGNLQKQTLDDDDSMQVETENGEAVISTIQTSNQCDAKWMPDDENNDNNEDENIVNIESDNVTADEDDDKSLAHNVEESLQLSKNLGNQGTTKKRKNAKRLLNKKNLQQNTNSSSDSEEEQKIVL